eukprot:scaffold101421_cov69-Phaeocystis_antarctica.AAC.2
MREELPRGEGVVADGLVQLVVVEAEHVLVVVPAVGVVRLAVHQVVRLGVVLRVRELPRVVRHEQARVQHVADRVVQPPRGGEAAVPALVREDPQAGEGRALEERVERPAQPVDRAHLLCAQRAVGEHRKGAHDEQVTRQLVQRSGVGVLEEVLRDRVTDVLLARQRLLVAHKRLRLAGGRLDRLDVVRGQLVGLSPRSLGRRHLIHLELGHDVLVRRDGIEGCHGRSERFRRVADAHDADEIFSRSKHDATGEITHQQGDHKIHNATILIEEYTLNTYGAPHNQPPLQTEKTRVTRQANHTHSPWKGSLCRCASCAPYRSSSRST